LKVDESRLPNGGRVKPILEQTSNFGRGKGGDERREEEF